MSGKAKHLLYVLIVILIVISVFVYYKLYWDVSISDISFSPTKDASSSDAFYVPKNLEDCHRELDRGLSQGAKQLIAADPSTLTKRQKAVLFDTLGHFGLGLWIRNNWGLWQGGPLAEYFYELGIYHPDDMSGIIMSSYIAKLRGEKYDLGREIKRYQRYWEQIKEPNDRVDPNKVE